MEQYIIYVIIAVSIVVNIYRNFQKQQEADSKRNVSKPVVRTQTASTTSANPPIFSKPKPQVASPAAKETRRDNSKSIIESDLEALRKNGGLATSTEYTSLESTLSDFSTIGGRTFSNMEGFEMDDTEENSEIKNDKKFVRKAHPLFENKDDFKKAILYSTILERKYV
ncbi:hypothetical protein [Viscerimonas tarda]